MSGKRRVLVYSDGGPIGGHEYMMARLVEELAADHDFSFTIAGSYDFLRLFSDDFEKVHCHVPPRCAAASLGLLWLLDWFELRKLFLSINPDTILVAQGTIEYGIKAVILAKVMQITVISYLPLVTNLTSSGSRFFPRTRDALNKLMYRLPDAFITISEHVQRQLLGFRKRNTDKIVVVTNWIKFAVEMEETESEAALFEWLEQERKSNKIVAAIVGRIEFLHKQQDKFIAELSTSIFRDRISVALVGAGSDASKLTDIVNRNANLRLYGPVFSRNLKKLYGSIDVLVVCSSLEGVPLVILEAISCDLRVVSFDFPSLKGYLGKEETVPIGDFHSLVDAIGNMTQIDKKKSPRNIKYLNPVPEQIGVVKRILLTEWQ